MEFNEKFMKRAIELSIQKMEEGCGGPFACVIVKDEEIIAEGWNEVTTSNDPTAHAEVCAIRKACEKLGSFQLNDCAIYTTTEPCPMCLGAIYWSRPKIIYYGNTRKDAAEIGFDDQFIYDELNLPLNSRALPIEQHMREEALVAFKAWINKSDRIQY